MTDDNIPAVARDNLPDHATRMQDLLGGIANIAASIAEAGGVSSQYPFIGINNDGVWAFGQDRNEVEIGSQWAIDIRTWQHGYIAWPLATAKERKPLHEHMVPANSPLPVLTSLPDVGAPYQLQFAFQLRCLTGIHAGTLAVYKNGSYGAKVIVQALVDEVRRQARIDPSRLCPVVTLEIRDYFHKEWKKTIYNPVLPVQKWISLEGDYDALSVGPIPNGDDSVLPAPEPRAAARGVGRRPEPEPVPVPRRPGRIQPGA